MDSIIKLIVIMTTITTVLTKDICKEPKPEIKCLKPSTVYWFNSETKHCDEYIGCQSSGNSFKTSTECMKKCSPIDIILSTSIRSKRSQVSHCSLAYDKGPCTNFTSRFYYNSQAKRCDLFIYGGCEGNGNNFRKYKQCKDACVKRKSPQENGTGNGNGNQPHSVCNLPKDTGDCRGSFKKYYFNVELKTCEQFIYGGCFGNGNNFDTIHECEQMCGNK